MKRPKKIYQFGIPLSKKNTFHVFFQKFPKPEDWIEIKKWVDCFGDNLIKRKRGDKLKIDIGG